MRVLVAPDKFKGSLSAQEVCLAIEKGLWKRNKNLVIEKIPMADGGEGTSSILTRYEGGEEIEVDTLDPLGRTIRARYGRTKDGKRAFIEMSAASGLNHLSKEERNAADTSTVGTGLLIRHAIEAGAEEIVFGIGGSATTDAGIGMASVLDYSFYDSSGRNVVPAGRNLEKISSILKTGDLLEHTKVTVLCDVNNPLYGRQGAAYVFAPQKGADNDTVEFLDRGLRHLARIVQEEFNVDLNFPGAGAGGGMGAGAYFFLKGKMQSGIDFMLEHSGLDEKIRLSDLVITGEGRLDEQSLSGKVVDGIRRLCMRWQKPFVVITGRNDLNDEQMTHLGAKKILSLTSGSVTPDFAIRHAAKLIENSIALDLPEPNSGQ